MRSRAAGDTQHALRDVDFRRGPNGEGRIVIDLSDAAAGIDIRQQGRALIIDFIQTSLPKNLERRLDVQDFGTPIVTVDTFTQGANTRMIVEPKGLWEHSAYQTDNRFILEVKPIVEDPNKLVQGTRQGYKGDKLSLNFQNVEVRAVLQVIADFTGLNIITSDSVSGSLTLRLKDIPWDQALDIIMQTKGLDMRKNGNVVLIAPREELALKEKQQLEAQKDISELEPLVSESFQLNYIKAQDLLNLITTNRQQQFGAGAGQTATTGGQGSFISKRGVAMVDPRSNILFVQDIPSNLDEIRKIIRQIDTAIRQVVIEARIVIASDKFGRQLGVRFGAQTGFRINNKYAVGQGGSLSTQPVVSTVGGTGTATRETRTQTPYELASGITYAGYSDSPQLNVNLPVLNAAGSLALTLINLGSGNLINLELSALESDNRGKVVSSPRVVTGDNQKAHIEQGTEIPVRDAGKREQSGHGAVQEGRVELERDAADHAGQPDHHDRRDAQGLGRPDGQPGRRIPGAFDRHAQRDHADFRQQRRHCRHRRHLRRDRQQHRRQGAVPRRHSGAGLPVQDHESHEREAGAPHLPHAARDQGIDQRDQVIGS